jgi:hypothetical protein
MWDRAAGGLGIIPNWGGNRSQDGNKHYVCGNPPTQSSVCWGPASWGVRSQRAEYLTAAYRSHGGKAQQGKNGERVRTGGQRDQSPRDKLGDVLLVQGSWNGNALPLRQK